MTHTLFVCTACASRQEGKLLAQSGGQRLLEAIRQHAQTWLLQNQFQVQPVKCLGVCHRECTIALSCIGKFTYIFGDLSVNETQVDTTATAVLYYASQYHDRQDGVVAFSDRDPLFKNGSVARIPPVS